MQKTGSSIKIQLIRSFVLSALMAIFLSSAAIFGYTFFERQDEEVRQLMQLAQVIGHNLEASIDFDDIDSATQIMSTFRFNKNLEAAYLLQADNQIFSRYIQENIDPKVVDEILNTLVKPQDRQQRFQYVDKNHIVISMPIVNNGIFYGALAIVSNSDALKNTLVAQLSVQGIAAIVALSLAFFLAFKLQKSFTTPVLKLTEAMKFVQSTESYQFEISYKGDNEFKVLIDGFSKMLKTINEQNMKITNEIADRIQSEYLTEKARLQIEEITNNIPGVVYQLEIVDRKFNFKFISHGIEILQGVSVESASNDFNAFIDSIYIDDRALFLAELKEAIANEQVFDHDYRVLNAQGEMRWVHVQASIQADRHSDEDVLLFSDDDSDIDSVGEIIVNGHLSDITDAKHAHDLVVQAEQDIHQAHKHVRDSIEYAALIQGTLIPEANVFDNYFSDSFALWQPKDVVGGDIYLVEQLNSHEIVIMVIDCTGHGVPGAFVTMLVKAVERQLMANLYKDKEVSPAKLLSVFNRSIKKLLKQESVDSISNAGFDGGILYYNSKEHLVRFAGANTPLFVLQNDKLTTIKGNRYSVGYKKCDINYQFTDSVIDTSEPTQLYLTTDGYLDQNGGEKDFPFGKKRFSKLIYEQIDHDDSFEDKKQCLLYELQKYQGDSERNDDVTVVGLKI